MNDLALSLLISFLGYSVLNVGQVFQKLGMDLSAKSRRKGIPVLLFANTTTISSTFILLIAISLGQVSLVGAMAGSGLVAMALASSLLLKEPLEWRILLSIAIIILGVFLLGYFAEERESVYHWNRFLAFGTSLTALLGAGIFFARGGPLYGPAIGGFAGAWAGLVTLLQKSADLYTGPPLLPGWITEGIVSLSVGLTIPEGFAREAVRVLINPYVPLWVLISTSSMIAIHFAFSRGKAVNIIPVYSALFILVPVLGGVAAFAEKLTPFQWAGVFVILTGSVILNVQRSAKRKGTLPISEKTVDSTS